MINLDGRLAVLPTIISSNNEENEEDSIFGPFYAERKRIWDMQSLIRDIIRVARSHQDFINSLGMIRGEYSSENIKLKKIHDRKFVHMTPKIPASSIIMDVVLDAIEVTFLVNKGFMQIKKPVPENIQNDLTRLNFEVADLTKSVWCSLA